MRAARDESCAERPEAAVMGGRAIGSDGRSGFPNDRGRSCRANGARDLSRPDRGRSSRPNKLPKAPRPDFQTACVRASMMNRLYRVSTSAFARWPSPVPSPIPFPELLKPPQTISPKFPELHPPNCRGRPSCANKLPKAPRSDFQTACVRASMVNQLYRVSTSALAIWPSPIPSPTPQTSPIPQTIGEGHLSQPGSPKLPNPIFRLPATR
jgi:hypothetical protein